MLYELIIYLRKVSSLVAFKEFNRVICYQQFNSDQHEYTFKLFRCIVNHIDSRFL